MDQRNYLTPVAVADQPYGEDLLGYGPYVEAIAMLLQKDELETPFVVGIHGAWGTGKSTFMQLVDRKVEKAGIDTVFFQPWQFEDKEEVWKALIYSVINYLEAKASEAEKQSELLKNIIIGVGKLALNKSLQAMTGDKLNYDEIVNVYTKASRDNANFINTFRLKFGELKKTILSKNTNNNNQRLIVFVDDLDRCTPENAIMVLEAIKLFFDQNECIFVLGIDREVVQKGVDFKYKSIISISGRDYLEKIIQLPFTLPPIADESFKNFVNIITSEFDFTPVSIRLLIEASDKNPRRVKRLSNCLHLVASVAKHLAQLEKNVNAIKEIDEGKLALLLIIQVRFPLIYHWWSNNLVSVSEMQNNWNTEIREKVVHFLTSMYGETEAVLTSNKFYMLLVDNGQLIEDFKNAEELKGYFAITGLVDSDQSSQCGKTIEFYDEKYKIQEKDNTISFDSIGSETDKIPNNESTAEVFEGQCLELIGRSDSRKNKSSFKLLFSSLSVYIEDFLRDYGIANQLVEEIEQSISNSNKTGDRIKLNKFVQELVSINPTTIYNQLVAVRQILLMLSAIIPIGMVFLNSIIEYWVFSIRTGIEGLNFTNWFIDSFIPDRWVFYLMFVLIFSPIIIMRSTQINHAVKRIASLDRSTKKL